MKNPEKLKIPAKRELKQVIAQALRIRKTLIDQGKTHIPEYGFLCHYIDLYDRGVTHHILHHLTRAIQDILNREDLQHLFPKDVS